MYKLLLPLVEYLVDKHLEIDLSNTLIIGAQHILETTHSMFQSLYKLGLKPSNVHLIGKCYSTSREVYDEMRSEGFDISSGSFSYSSHIPFDQQYEEEVFRFLSSHIEDMCSKNYDRIIVLDDGGKCINFIGSNIHSASPIIAIEQTTAGYEAIKNKKLSFPIINVARSPIKLALESPMIAQAAAERLCISLGKLNLQPPNALIVGGGAIGQAMKNRLSSEMDVQVYDIKKECSHDLQTEMPNLAKFALIIGCTGKISIPHTYHSQLAPGTTLVSVSSSDREFDAVQMRKQIPENESCHCDLMINDILLVNSGFPVNFDGQRENIHPSLIQLTIALITAGILQACKNSGHLPKIISVDSKLGEEIISEFTNLKLDIRKLSSYLLKN